MCVFSRFDLPILLPSIVKFADTLHLNYKVLKKNTQIINLVISKASNGYSKKSDPILSIRDVLKYTAPCSLASFLSQWRVKQQKGFFPHG